MLSGSDYPRFVGSIMKDIKYLSRKSPDMTNLTHIFLLSDYQMQRCCNPICIAIIWSFATCDGTGFTLHPLMSAELACEFVSA